MSGFVFRLTDFKRTIDLVYKVGQDDFGILAAEAGIDMPEVFWHVPDTGERVPVSVNTRDRVFDIVLDVEATTKGNPDEALAIIKQMVDGATSQCVRSYTNRNIRPVYLEVGRPGGTTSPVISRIKVGSVNDGGSGTYNNASLVSSSARNVSMRLIITPTGEPRRPIRLKNMLPGGKIESGKATGGVAWGWASDANGGSLTTTIDTNVKMLHASMKVLWDGSTANQNVTADFDEIDTLSSGQHFTACYWTYHPSNESSSLTSDDIVHFLKNDTNGNLYQYPITNQRDFGTYVDDDGRTWRKWEFNGTLESTPTGTGFKIDRDTVNASHDPIFIGGGYVHIDPEPENEFDNPVMHLDSNSDGRADNINTVSGTVSFTHSSLGGMMTGGFRQKADCTGASEFKTDTVTVSTGNRVRAHVWLWVENAADEMRVELVSGTNDYIIDTKNVTDSSGTLTNEYSCTNVGVFAGTTWYRFDLEGDIMTEDDFFMRFVTDDDGDWNIDSIWLEIVDTEKKRREGMPLYPLRSPDALSTYAVNLANRADPGSSDTDYEAYVDVVNIPGDEFALVSQTVSVGDNPTNTDGFEYIIVARHTGNADGNLVEPYYVDATDSNVSATGGYSRSAQLDADRMNAGYVLITAGASGSATFSYTPTDAKWYTQNRRILGVMGTEDTPEFDVTLPLGYGTWVEGSQVVGPALAGADFPYLVDIGLINSAEAVEEYLTTFTPYGNQEVSITMDEMDSGDDLYLEGFYFVPIEADGWLIFQVTSSTNVDFYLDAHSEYVIITNDNVQPSAVVGKCYTAQSGLPSRFYYLGNFTDDQRILNTFTVQMDVYPQVRHLLGSHS